MAVSEKSSQVVYKALKSVGVQLVSALPETWLVHLIRLAEEDPDMTLVRVNKEEEACGHLRGSASGRKNFRNADAEPWVFGLH